MKHQRSGHYIGALPEICRLKNPLFLSPSALFSDHAVRLPLTILLKVTALALSLVITSRGYLLLVGFRFGTEQDNRLVLECAFFDTPKTVNSQADRSLALA